MVHHMEITQQLKSINPDKPFSAAPEDKELLLTVCLHSADLSNPLAKSFNIARSWALRICEEFSEQVKKERASGLTPAPFMDITNMQAVGKLQCTYYDFVIRPYFSALAVVFPVLSEQLDRMAAHRQQWQCVADNVANAAIPFP